MMAKSDATPYFSILSSQAAALLENGDKQEARSLSGPKKTPDSSSLWDRKSFFNMG
jgi:hypothetical protein